MQKPNYPLIYVRYHDHFISRDRTIEDLEHETCILETVGFLVAETAFYLFLSNTKSSNDQYDFVAIMKSTILNQRVIQKARK